MSTNDSDYLSEHQAAIEFENVAQALDEYRDAIALSDYQNFDEWCESFIDALEPAKLSSVGVPAGFFLDHSGVHAFRGEDAEVNVCGPLVVDALLADDDRKSFGYLLKYQNLLGEIHQWAVSADLLSGRADGFEKALLGRGVRVFNVRLLVCYITSFQFTKVLQCVLQAGWQDGAYVLPSQCINGDYVYQGRSDSGEIGVGGTLARGDVCRAKLVAEVLSIGTVRLSGAQPCLIIPPWHPERMKALAVKTRRVAGLVTHMLGGKDVLFGDRGIFFREFSEELAHPFYPEIGVVMRGATPHLVAETSTVNGYSLLESPERGAEDQFSDVDPSAAAKQIRELLERYVGLQPHEGANLTAQARFPMDKPWKTR